MKKNALVLLVLAATLGAATYWYLAARKPETGKSAKGMPPVPVLLAKAKVQDMPVFLDVVGRAEAYENVTVRSRVDGQVASVVFTEGLHVRQGDELVRLDPTDFELRLRQAEANVARDEAQLVKAKADTVRYVALFNRKFVSEEMVSTIRTAEATAVATLNADKAAAELARAQLSYTTVRAPFSGVIGARLIFPGGAVKSNDTALATINRVSPLYISFSIPEKYLPKARSAMSKEGAGCEHGGCLKVSAALPGDNKQRVEGVVRFIDNAVDPATGTIRVKAVFDNKHESLTPGQYLNLSLNLDTLPNAVVVPNEAVQQGADGPFIFVVDAQGAAEVHPVEVASSLGGVTAISKGIQPGDTVVTDGQLRLAPGVKVVARTTEARTSATQPQK